MQVNPRIMVLDQYCNGDIKDLKIEGFLLNHKPQTLASSLQFGVLCMHIIRIEGLLFTYA